MIQKFTTRYPDHKMAYHFSVRSIVPEKIVSEVKNMFFRKTAVLATNHGMPKTKTALTITKLVRS